MDLNLDELSHYFLNSSLQKRKFCHKRYFRKKITENIFSMPQGLNLHNSKMQHAKGKSLFNTCLYTIKSSPIYEIAYAQQLQKQDTTRIHEVSLQILRPECS
jgi:hypothetical protein